MQNDPPIHLSGLSICKKSPHTEPSVTVQVQLNQSALDGIQAMLTWAHGFEAAGKASIPGAFETLMFYRGLRHIVSDSESMAKKGEGSTDG